MVIHVDKNRCRETHDEFCARRWLNVPNPGVQQNASLRHGGRGGWLAGVSDLAVEMIV